MSTEICCYFLLGFVAFPVVRHAIRLPGHWASVWEERKWNRDRDNRRALQALERVETLLSKMEKEEGTNVQ